MSNISSKDEKQPYEKKLSGIEIPDPRGDFNKLDESQKEEVIRRAKLLYKEFADMYKDPVFFGLTYKANIDQIMRLFIEQNTPAANLVYYTLHKRRAETETEEDAFAMDESINWIMKIMHLLNIEINTALFPQEVVMDYWLPYMENKKILSVSEDGVTRNPKPSEPIIWNLLMAKAENVYGIRLMNSGNPAKWEELEGLCDILKDELIRLDKFNRKDEDKEFIDLVTEIKKLSEYWLIRYVDDSSYDDPEGKKDLTSRETISILGNVSEKAVVNAGLKGEIELEKIQEQKDKNPITLKAEDVFIKYLEREPVTLEDKDEIKKNKDIIQKEKEPVTYYQTDSALKWLQDSKRRHKFKYLPSLKVSNKYEDRDNFLVIPAESIEELEYFIEEYSPGSFDKLRGENDKPRDENIKTFDVEFE